MNNDSSLKNCLTLTGGLLGIFVALITVIKFLFPKAQDFPAFMSNVWPGLASGLQATSNAIHGFASSNPFTPWWTAVLVIIMGTIIAYVTDMVSFFELGLLPIWAGPALLWLFVFYGIVNTFGMIAFLIVYFLAPKGVDLVISRF